MEIKLHFLKIDDLKGLNVQARPFDKGTTFAYARLSSEKNCIENDCKEHQWTGNYDQKSSSATVHKKM